jgi:ADP-dependent NAD(P)H-hydrate dehydratase / NAD(P)H-hydrate epimerase
VKVAGLGFLKTGDRTPVADAVLNAHEMQAVERAAFDDGLSAESLMDCAGEGIANVILKHQPRPGVCVAYLGKGNNAGDAIVAGSLLAKAGWEIRTRSLVSESDLQVLPRKKWRDLQAQPAAGPITDLPKKTPRVILDGLLGLGSRSGLNASLKALTRELNALRLESNANVYAVDLPTGLGEDSIDPDAVVADFTLTIGFPKTALFRDDAPNFVGHILVIDLPELTSRGPKEPDRPMLSSPESLRKFVPRRLFDSHKGDFGRIGIVAGSRGLVGASVLCSEAAARAGGGLISLYVPEEIYNLVVCKVTPEIMVKPTRDFRSVIDERLDALGVGPGLGSIAQQEILEVVTRFAGPMVVDADALNALSTAVGKLQICAGPRLLTPHPGEMARLWATSGKSRLEIVREFTAEFPAALLLKGSRTLVGQSGKPMAFNTTGSPGLATGGSGDVLTGVCAAFLARKIPPYDAGRLGAWLCGRAAEIAVNHSSEESMLPSDLFSYLGPAFAELRNG